MKKNDQRKTEHCKKLAESHCGTIRISRRGARRAELATVSRAIKSNQIKSNLFPNAKTVHTANM